MGTREIKMPGLGESVHETTISQWYVKPGDEVKKYDDLLEAQSDKVVTAIPSEFSGTVKELLADEGDVVKVGSSILILEVEGDEEQSEKELSEESSTTKSETKSEKSENTTFSPSVVKIAQERGIDLEQVKGTGKGGRVTRKDVQNYSPEETRKDETVENNKEKPRYSPAVLKIASERGIDLNDVTGTGKDGRITRKDIQNHDPNSVIKSDESIDTSQEKSEESIVFEGNDRQKVVPADGIRKAIAKNMKRSYSEIPHAWLMVEADVTNIVELRNSVKETYEKDEGIKISYFPFFVKAVATALKKYPILNASWQDENIIYNKDINISIAVGTDEHLYVPVIKNADQLSIHGITKEIDRLAAGARNGKLTSDDMNGGTITVNNTGTFGSIQSMGIINHPQVAILQVESIQEKVIVKDGGIKLANMVNLCLSIDHRLLDGMQAGGFLKEVKNNLNAFSEESDIY